MIFTGLLKRAIIQSASCTNTWALSMNAKERTFRLGEVLGLKTEDPEELLKFLQQVPALDIVNAQFKTLTHVVIGTNTTIKSCMLSVCIHYVMFFFSISGQKEHNCISICSKY